MVTAVGGSAYGPGTPCPSCTAPVARSVAALQGRIRQDQIQLNDWTTCVSSKTTKGQTAIQKLAGEISATKEQIARVLEAQSAQVAPSAQPSSPAHGVTSRSASGRFVDVWA